MHVRPFRCLDDLLFARFQVAIFDVVTNGVVEQRRILRHDADRLAQALERDVADILAIDQNASFLYIVVAEEQAQDCGFSAAGRTHDGDLLAGGDGEVQVLEDGAVGTVTEGYVFEFDFALGKDERFDAWLVLHGDVGFLQAEECVHVQQRLAQLAVHGAEEVQGDGELEDELVHHDEVANGHGSFCDTIAGKVHHGRQG